MSAAAAIANATSAANDTLAAEPSYRSTMTPGTYVLASAHVQRGRLDFAVDQVEDDDDRHASGLARPGRIVDASGVRVLHIHSADVARDNACITGNTPFGPLSRSRDHVLYRYDGHPTMKDCEFPAHEGIGTQYGNHWAVIEIEAPTPISLSGSILTIGDVSFDVNGGYAYQLEDGAILRNDHPAHALLGLDSPSDDDELDGEGVWSHFEVDDAAIAAIAAMDDPVSRSLLKDLERQRGRSHASFEHWVEGQSYSRAAAGTTLH